MNDMAVEPEFERRIRRTLAAVAVLTPLDDALPLDPDPRQARRSKLPFIAACAVAATCAAVATVRLLDHDPARVVTTPAASDSTPDVVQPETSTATAAETAPTSAPPLTETAPTSAPPVTESTPTVLPLTETAPTSAPRLAETAPPASAAHGSLRILVLNGQTGVAGAATEMTSYLNAAGYTSTLPPEDGPAASITTVYYGPGLAAPCKEVAALVAERTRDITMFDIDDDLVHAVPAAEAADCVVLLAG
jgi:hypothetical protein